MERQITTAAQNHILTNTSVWSPRGDWIVYDTRSDPAGSTFDGMCVEAVNALSGETKRLYQSRNGACCGVVTCHPKEEKVLFILGPENPTPDWAYGASHRQGMIVRFDQPNGGECLDARDLTMPFTPGSLRGGTHLHVWDSAGEWISFTYHDAFYDSEVRDVGISLPGRAVLVSDDHSRNHNGSHYSMIVSRTQKCPRNGTDDIQWAGEESWVGRRGYTSANGTRVTRALAFQGHVVSQRGDVISEVFICDLPESFSREELAFQPRDPNQRPTPPPGVRQRRLTFTHGRKYPGLQGPRHWLRSSPDGSSIAFLMKDDDGICQIWLVSPNGGEPKQLTHNEFPITSAFTWCPRGQWIAHVMDGGICVTDVTCGKTHRLTNPTGNQAQGPPRAEACVFSPDGQHIAYVKPILSQGKRFNQIFCVRAP